MHSMIPNHAQKPYCTMDLLKSCWPTSNISGLLVRIPSERKPFVDYRYILMHYCLTVVDCIVINFFQILSPKPFGWYQWCSGFICTTCCFSWFLLRKSIQPQQIGCRCPPSCSCLFKAWNLAVDTFTWVRWWFYRRWEISILVLTCFSL